VNIRSMISMRRILRSALGHARPLRLAGCRRQLPKRIPFLLFPLTFSLRTIHFQLPFLLCFILARLRFFPWDNSGEARSHISIVTRPG
jgi:hypothetical protein